MDGKRACIIFCNIAEPSEIVEAVEPLFLNLKASVEMVPVMTADDLKRGLAKAGK
jgi:hypothetical protein